MIEDGTESGEGDGFFRGFDRRRDQGVRVRIGEVRLLKRRLFGIVGDDVRRGECQHEVARGGTCARQSQRGTLSLPVDHLRKAPKVVIDILRLVGPSHPWCQ